MPPKTNIRYYTETRVSKKQMYDLLTKLGMMKDEYKQLDKKQLIAKMHEITGSKSFNIETMKPYTAEEESQLTQAMTAGQTTQINEPQDDLTNEEKNLAATTIQKIARGKQTRKKLKLKDAQEAAVDTVNKILDNVENFNISKYKTRQEKKARAKKILDQLKGAERAIFDPTIKSENMKKQAADKLARESLIKLYKNAYMKIDERESQKERKDLAATNIQRIQRGNQTRKKLKEAEEEEYYKKKELEEQEYHKAAEKYYKTPETLRAGKPPKPPRRNIIFDPSSIIPEEDHKAEPQFKKITRKNVGKIDDGVKTDKKKLNTHVDPTVNLSDIQKALNKQKDRMKLRPAKIIYHRLGKPIATATRDTF